MKHKVIIALYVKVIGYNNKIMTVHVHITNMMILPLQIVKSVILLVKYVILMMGVQNAGITEFKILIYLKNKNVFVQKMILIIIVT